MLNSYYIFHCPHNVKFALEFASKDILKPFMVQK